MNFVVKSYGKLFGWKKDPLLFYITFASSVLAEILTLQSLVPSRYLLYTVENGGFGNFLLCSALGAAAIAYFAKSNHSITKLFGYMALGVITGYIAIILMYQGAIRLEGPLDLRAFGSIGSFFPLVAWVPLVWRPLKSFWKRKK